MLRKNKLEFFTLGQLARRYHDSGFKEVKLTPQEYSELMCIVHPQELDELIKERKYHGIPLQLYAFGLGEYISWPKKEKKSANRKDPTTNNRRQQKTSRVHHK